MLEEKGSYHKFKCDGTVNHIEVAAADIRDLPRQLGDTSNICFDVHSMHRLVPTSQTECSENGVL
jgi:hypothetical protein